MAEFVCKVGDASGRIFQQVETAQSEDEARQRLSERGFYVFSIRDHFDLLSQLGRSRCDRSNPSRNDFLIFNQQFNTLVKAGLPILKALDLLAERAAAAATSSDFARCSAARARWRAAIGGAGRTGFVPAGLRHRDHGGRAQRQSDRSPRPVHHLPAGQHRVSAAS